MTELHRLLWAKSDPYHQLWRHLLDIAAVAKAVQPRFWPDTPIPLSWLLYLVALHDVGKADPLFQNKAPEAIDAALLASDLFADIDPNNVRGFRHERRSAEWLWDALEEAKWGRRAINVVAAAIQGHHGNFDPKYHADRHEASWGPLRAELAALLRKVLRPDSGFQPKAFKQASTAGLMLTGLIVLSDWIASGEYPYGYHTVSSSDDPAEYFEAACARAEEVVGRMGLVPPAPPTPATQPLKFVEVWPAKEELRNVQEVLQQAVASGVPPGLTIIEAPMGEGKTEAAVYLAEEWHRQRGTEGVYFALPTMATSNQMHGRYAKYLHDREKRGYWPRLVHGMSWLIGDGLPKTAPETDDGPLPSLDARARSWFASPKRALLAPQGVGTVDQALMSALLVKYGFLRLFGLGRKVLIVDEVHAYDAYMQTILRRLLEWCRELHVPVVLLSATLSGTQRRALLSAYAGKEVTEASKPRDTPYPLLSFAPLGGDLPAVPVTLHYDQRHVALVRQAGALHDAAQVADLAAGAVAQGGCVCVLVNTVRRAQEVFRLLRARKTTGGLPGTDLTLFHARFTARQRDTIEKEVVGKFGPNGEDSRLPNPKRAERAIVVCTQVVEQSLDVCFDELFTDLAPIDLLLQRSGRMYRHAPNTRHGRAGPRLHVLLPGTEEPLKFGAIELREGKDGSWRGVYDRAALLRTLAALDRPEIVLPQDFRGLIEGVYGELEVANDALGAECLSAEEARTRRQQQFEHLAKKYLIREPSPRVFQYAEDLEVAEEAEEGANKSYFRAQTRLGDDTRAALVLTDEKLIARYKEASQKSQLDKKYQPTPELLRDLFWQKANLPGYWLAAEPRNGAAPFQQGQDVPSWVRGHVVVFAPGRQWAGLLSGKPVVLQVDDTLGLLLENAETAEEGIEGA